MARKSIPEFDLNAFSGTFRAESDRACAVLGAALLDARLERLYERRLRQSIEQLLYNNGPISTFSARIRVAHALAWISDDVSFDLHKVREIRNAFAHDADHELSFENSSILDKCRTLRVAKTLIEASEHAASIPHPNFSAAAIRAMGAVFEPPRQRFEVTVEILAQHIDELPAEAGTYAGPNLKEELWALGSRVNIKISATATVGAPQSIADRTS
jgi:hypothetical protein